MARPRKSEEEKAKAKAEKEAAKNGGDALGEALRYCAPGFKDGGELYAQHAYIHAGWMTTYDGVLMFGTPIPQQFSALPHFGKLQAAIKAAGTEGLSIAQLDQGRLSVKGKKFRAIVPCLSDAALVTRHQPDNPISALDSRMRDGFEIMKQVSAKNAEHVLTSSVLVDNGSMTATDRKLIVQFWHGIGFPRLTVPAQFVEAVLKVTKPLVAFGYTDVSLTFWFEDNSFIRTQLYAEDWPDIESVWPADWSSAKPVPGELFDALATLRPFLTQSRYAVCDTGVLRSHIQEEVGASIDVPGLDESTYGLDVDRLIGLRGRITHMDYYSGDKTFFFGENVKGVCVNFLFEEEPDESDNLGQTQAPAEPAFNPPQAVGPVEYDQTEQAQDVVQEQPQYSGFATPG